MIPGGSRRNLSESLPGGRLAGSPDTAGTVATDSRSSGSGGRSRKTLVLNAAACP
jgi:hypothetical protein